MYGRTKSHDLVCIRPSCKNDNELQPYQPGKVMRCYGKTSQDESYLAEYFVMVLFIVLYKVVPIFVVCG